MQSGKPGSKAERDALSRAMTAAGRTLEAVAGEMTKRWGYRPRAALRHAHGWSQDELAARVSSLYWRTQRQNGGSPGEDVAVVPGRRIGEYERWPFGGRRPTPYVLMILAQALGTSVDELLDRHDLLRLPPTERALLAALSHGEDAARDSPRPAPLLSYEAPYPTQERTGSRGYRTSSSSHSARVQRQ